MATLTQFEITTQLNYLIKLLNNYKWLTESYMLDFFTCDNFSKLPISWTSKLSHITVEEFGTFLDWFEPINNVWPLSLLAIRSIIRSKTLPRHSADKPYIWGKCEITEEKPKQTVCFHHKRLKNLFLKHVKPKKRYEIEKMAEVTAQVAAKHRVTWVIDIGSGLGHLCRTLAYGYGLKVIGVEAQTQLSVRAERLDKELEVTASKHLAEEELLQIQQYRPFHKEATIESNTTEQLFTKMIDENSGEENEHFGIVGLHPCGDLAVILLKIFIKCPRAKFIHVIGCCYHKMTLSGPKNKGYPMSQAMTAIGSDLTAETAALGCHAIEAYSARLRIGDYEHLKVHCFRAALERIIARRWPHHARSGLNNARHYPGLSFPQYCERALQILGVSVPPEDLESKETLADLAQWKDAVFFHSLWLMLGPAIESVILLDRLLYLTESGIPCQIQAAFDPLISPRNHIITAIKPS